MIRLRDGTLLLTATVYFDQLFLPRNIFSKFSEYISLSDILKVNYDFWNIIGLAVRIET